ncbi:TRAP transporter small permease [Marinobacter sp. Arc7-DN-1]|jgi:TRAP-type C4-dicarboxylate transport system permease small subunit|uniref:TRAP transporter small permease n=1 Tax=Marinobacter sp. Arc7-DN-1 TaxID=2304594 RepID=UPI000E446A4D|nr:TRAP transporter small permease [Marinobacter sp. Arc7-DN-1]AXS83133.1 TRAP transporter small permease [Marinobacter sp. Arc7-DN-1]
MPNQARIPDNPKQKAHVPAFDAGLLIILFWTLAFVVFVQFFTRYVLNDSIGWTEELARYLLIVVTFAGACVAVRRNTHISVEFFYRYLPPGAARGLSMIVDLLRTLLFAALTGLTFQLAGNTRQMMTAIDMPKSVLYGLVAGCFALMTIYSVMVTWRHLVSGKSDVSPDVKTGHGQ